MSTVKGDSTALFWIVKDSHSTSLSHSDQLEASKISKFVQQRLVKAPRHAKPKKNVREYDFLAFQTSSQRAQDQALKVVQSPVGTHIPFDQANDRELYAGQWPYYFSRLPKDNILFGSGVDPFLSTVVPITSELCELIGYSRACILIGAGGYKIEAFHPCQRPFADMYNAAAHLTLTNIFRFKHVLYPMLAAFSQRLHCRGQFPFASIYNPEHYIRFGLRALSAAISDGHSAADKAKSLALGIYFMVFGTGMAGRIEESQLHIRAFLKLLPHINTAIPAEFWLFDTTISMDMINSSHLGSNPVIGFASGDPGPMPRSRYLEFVEKLTELKQKTSKASNNMCEDCEAIVFGPQNAYMRFDLLQSQKENLELDLGSALTAALDESRIQLRLSSVVVKLLECLDVAKVIWQADDFVTKQDSTWLCRRVKALWYELLSMQSAFVGAISFRDCEARCLLLTMIITVTGAYHRMLHLSRRPLTNRLKEAMEDLLLHKPWTQPVHMGKFGSNAQGRSSDEMCLWMLFMGYWASAYTSTASWFKEQAVARVRMLEIRSRQELHQIMNKHFWSKTVQHDSLSEIWEQVHQSFDSAHRNQDE